LSDCGSIPTLLRKDWKITWNSEGGSLKDYIENEFLIRLFRLTKVKTSDPRESEAHRRLANAERALASFQDEFEPAALAGLSDLERGLCVCAVMVDEARFQFAFLAMGIFTLKPMKESAMSGRCCWCFPKVTRRS